MRISDWSSDVCSSDLYARLQGQRRHRLQRRQPRRPREEIREARTQGRAARGRQGRRAPGPLAETRTRRRNRLRRIHRERIARKSVVSGKSVSVRVDLGGRGVIKKKKHKKH